MNSGANHAFAPSQYDTALQISFYICKIPTDNPTDSYISTGEIRGLKKWLCRTSPHELSFVGYEDYHWNGSFNCTEIMENYFPVALNLTFTCDAPWGYGKKVTKTFNLKKDGTAVNYAVDTDFEGYFYPKVIIAAKQSGDLAVRNHREDRVLKIQNVVSGQTFVCYPNLYISGPDHYKDDFNYMFLRLYASNSDNVNTFTANMDVQVTLEYDPVRKLTFS